MHGCPSEPGCGKAPSSPAILESMSSSGLIISAGGVRVASIGPGPGMEAMLGSLGCWGLRHRLPSPARAGKSGGPCIARDEGHFQTQCSEPELASSQFSFRWTWALEMGGPGRPALWLSASPDRGRTPTSWCQLTIDGCTVNQYPVTLWLPLGPRQRQQISLYVAVSNQVGEKDFPAGWRFFRLRPCPLRMSRVRGIPTEGSRSTARCGQNRLSCKKTLRLLYSRIA